MVPLTLSVKNFLSYGESTSPLDFRGFDVACLSGRNGHGKSALIDALTWALWGRCRVKNKEEVIKRGASDSRVELEFESEGNRYRVLRSISKKRGGSQGTIDLQVYDEGSGSYKQLDQGAKAQNTIEKILKMDYNSFICSSFILQGMADEFTKRTPAERKEILSRILELDEYETLTRRAREHAQASGLEAAALESESNRLDDEISQKETFEKKLLELRNEEEAVSGGIARFEAIRGKLIGEYESLKAKIDTLERLGRARDDAQSLLRRLEEELLGARESIMRDREIVSREAEILEAFNEYKTAREKLRVMNERELLKSNLEKELAGVSSLIENEKAKLEQKAGALEARIGEHRKIITSTEETLARRREIEEGYRKLREASALDTALDEKRAEAIVLDRRSAELEQSIGQKRVELEAKAKELSSRIKELEAKASSSGRLAKEVEHLRARIAECTESSPKADVLREELRRMGGEKKAEGARKSELERRKTEEEQKLHVLSEGDKGTHCPLCESPLGEEARAALIEKLTKTVSELTAGIRGAGKRIAELESREKTLGDELALAESRVKLLPSLHKELGEKEQRLSESEAASLELEEAKKSYDAVSGSIRGEEFRKEYEGEIRELERKRSRLGYDEARHGGLKKEIESLRRYETEHELLKKEAARSREAVSEIMNAEKELSPLLETLREGRYAGKWKERTAELRSELDELGYDEREHREVKDSVTKLERSAGERETLERARLSLRLRENEERKLTERIGEEREKLEKIENEIKELSGIEIHAREIREKMSAADDRVAALKKQKEELLMDISRSTGALERIQELAARKNEVNVRIAETKRELLIFQELAKAFGKNGLQALIIEHAVPEIEAEANRILNKLTEGTMTLSLEMVRPTQKGGEKETLEIHIGDSSGTRSYETFSGGEAFRIDFALRVGISKFIANRSGAQLRTLVIDEGFGTQDRDGLNQFVQVINSIKDDFDKILAITHVDELKERFPVRIEVTKEPGSGSSFEVVYS